MRIFSLVAAIVVLGAACTGVAQAAPGPRLVAGVGSDTTEVLFAAFAQDYTGARVANYRATGSPTITTKPGCDPITRPNGSSPGVAAIAVTGTDDLGKPCIDFARSLAPRAPGAPADSVFYPVAADGLTYAVNAGGNAPTTLSRAQIASILECQTTTWDQVGGTSARTIQPFVPDAGPGLVVLLHALLGVDSLGTCVGVTQQDQGTAPEIKGNPDALAFYSIGKYLGQAYYHHEDVHGALVLGAVDGLTPTVFDPATGRVEINLGQVAGVPAIDPPLRINEWAVVRKGADGQVPLVLQQFFAGPGSWVCTNPVAGQDIRDYGFLPAANCGVAA